MVHLKTRINAFDGFGYYYQGQEYIGPPQNGGSAWYDTLGSLLSQGYQQYNAGLQRNNAAAVNAAAAAAARTNAGSVGLSTAAIILLCAMGFLIVFTLMKNR